MNKVEKTLVDELLSKNVNNHTEKKNGLTYLSWAWAWAEALKVDPLADYEVQMFDDRCFMEINGTAMVFVTVTLAGKSRTCQLPVMDYRNKAIQDPDAFAVNTAIMRCMTKALSLHGLGLYIYAGEDLPDGAEEVFSLPESKVSDLIAFVKEAVSLDDLKINYGMAIKECKTDQEAQKLIIAAKDEMKKKLGG